MSKLDYLTIHNCSLNEFKDLENKDIVDQIVERFKAKSMAGFAREFICNREVNVVVNSSIQEEGDNVTFKVEKDNENGIRRFKAAQVKQLMLHTNLPSLLLENNNGMVCVPVGKMDKKSETTEETEYAIILDLPSFLKPQLATEEQKLGKKIDSQSKEVAKCAISIFNDIRDKNSADALWKLFRAMPFGWEIPINIDDSMDLESRREDIDKHLDEDVLGAYIVKQNDKTRKYEHNIVLYTKAIREFARILEFDPEQLCAYVLAHEVFHSWQDFHIDSRDVANNQNIRRQKECYAEFFALRFAKELNEDLFEALHDEHKNTVISGYSDAVVKSMFGDIKNEDCVENFNAAADKWLMDTINMIYGIPDSYKYIKEEA